MTTKIELGQTVYIRAGGAYDEESRQYEADVTYVGAAHFTAGDYTFKFMESPVKIGNHARASAYVSKAVYLKWREARKAWERLRYTIWSNLNPPEHLTPEQIREMYRTIFPED